MAVPLTPDQFVNALRAEGLRVVTVGEWRTHNRNHKGPWGPVHGVLMHHTAGGSSGAVDYCYDGSSDLPGPLCQGVITKDGTVHVISAGRSNHAGGGDPNVLAAVKDERYGDRPPVPHQHQGSAGAVDGNPHFYGFECVNFGDGKDPWPAAQVDAMVRAGAAVSRAYGWTEKSVIAHREWSDQKPDPAGPGMPGMPEFRARIKERLAHGPSWSPGTTPAPPATGTPMTAPARSLLQRTENLTLLENVPQTIYWTIEYPDDANGHGEGGKTVGSNIRYSAVVNLRLAGLGDGQVVEVYAAEEDANGVLLGESEIRHQIRGRELGYHPIAESAPVIGSVANRLVFRVVSRSPQPVTVEEAWLSMQSWPLNA